MHKLKNLNIQQNLGFGLIELMVSISIVVLVTSVILAKHDSYNSAILLRSQTYDIALKMREVQLLSVSATGQGGDYRNVMGLYFNTGNSYYKVFVDKNNNYFYDPNENEDFGPQINLDKRFEFASLNLVGSSQNVDEVSVIFERPNFDARFFTAENEEAANVSGIALGIGFKGAEAGSENTVRTLDVSRTGQIIVRPLTPIPINTNCPVNHNCNNDEDRLKDNGIISGDDEEVIIPGTDYPYTPGGGGDSDSDNCAYSDSDCIPNYQNPQYPVDGGTGSNGR